MMKTKNKKFKIFQAFFLSCFLLIFSFFISQESKAACLNVPMGGSYTVSDSCIFAGTVDGADGGGITVNAGKMLTIGAGQTIVWSPNYSLTVNGEIWIDKTDPGTSGQLKKAYIWLADSDNDGYPTTTTPVAQLTSATSSQYRRSDTRFTGTQYHSAWASTAAIAYDAVDTNSSVYPGTNCGTACTENKTDGTCGSSAINTDPGSLCTGLTCSGYYTGWVGNICYSAAAVSAAGHVCDGVGACKSSAAQCTTQGSSYLTRTNCKTKVGCTDTTVGSLGNVADGSDTSSDCAGLDCDGGATKYYNGWTSGTCYYRLDVSAANHVCDGAGACKTAAVQCAASSQGASAGVTRTPCKTQVGCTGTTVGSLGNVADGSDTSSDCAGLDCDGGATKYYNGWTSGTCYYRLDVSAANHVCDGAGACKLASVQCTASTQGATTGVARTTCKTMVGCSETTIGTLGNVAVDQDTYGDCAASACSNTGNCSGSGGLCKTVPIDTDPNNYCTASTCGVVLNSRTGLGCSAKCEQTARYTGDCDGTGVCAGPLCSCQTTGDNANADNLKYHYCNPDESCYDGYPGSCSRAMVNDAGYYGGYTQWTNCKCI